MQKIDLLPSVLETDLEYLNALENDQSVLETSIISKKDVDIAKMIDRLQNHDWVKQGKEFYEKNFDETKNAYICPFCQQKTTEEFKKQLEEYFDKTYKKEIERLNDYVQNYRDITDKIKKYLNRLLEANNEYINKKKDSLQKNIKLVESIIGKNLQTLNQKQSTPSQKSKIEIMLEGLREITSICDEVNNKINQHNDTIENKQKEKEILDSQIWKYIVEQLKDEINNYQNQDADIQRALDNLNKGIDTQQREIKKIDNEINTLEKKIKSVKPTVDAINKILANFGFRGFRLQATVDNKHYQVIRDDGSDAKKTLSEGERNFLIFLYFYNLIYGVENPEENINQDKILIIDDPVSSLDSEVLFIVSTLIKKILSKVRKNEGSVNQVFIFTHNAYFYKEITFISSSKSCYDERKDTMYYIVGKNDNISYVNKYNTCPIKTSYQLLWDDIKRDNIDHVSIHNSMRRIIEFYFKFLAGLNENKLVDKFEGDDKIICKSLFAFMHAGSHEVIDDYNINITNEQLTKYKEVFKKIFDETGHIAHYNMMMGITDTDESE